MTFAECLRSAPGNRGPGSPSLDIASGGGAVFGDAGAWHLAPFGAVEERAGLALVAHAETAQPFRRGPWVFAHEGKVDDPSRIRSELSPASIQQCADKPDGELLFAYVLGRLDERGLTEGAATEATDRLVAAAAVTLARRLGTLSFVLCDGTTLYVHRQGAPLHLLARLPVEGSTAVIVASEPITPEPWWTLDDGALVRCRREASGALGITFLAGRDPRTGALSDFEIPFTD
jgi:glutamine amidotransferase class II-like protein